MSGRRRRMRRDDGKEEVATGRRAMERNGT
jgi:hypothetical protein